MKKYLVIYTHDTTPFRDTNTPDQDTILITKAPFVVHGTKLGFDVGDKKTIELFGGSEFVTEYRVIEGFGTIESAKHYISQNYPDFDEVDERDSDGDIYYTKNGPEFMGREASFDYVFESMEENLSKDSTDEEIQNFISNAEYEVNNNKSNNPRGSTLAPTLFDDIKNWLENSDE